MAYAGKPYTGCGPFAQDIPAEAEQLGGAASGSLIELSSAFNQSTGFHEAAEVLLVQTHARESLDDPLQLK